MPSRSSPQQSLLPINNTVKLSDTLRERVEKAMEVEGFTVWSEFCRVALTEKCQLIERSLRESDPDQYRRIYQRADLAGKDGADGRNGGGRDGAGSASVPNDKSGRDGR